MKNLTLLIFIIFTTLSFSQNNPNEDFEEVAFTIIENVPVYSTCDETSSNQELKQCMSSKIGELISKKFNIKLANSLGLPSGKVRINVMFKIDKKGNVVNIEAKAPHEKLEKEAIRVINLIPKLKRPGVQRGKPVIVHYAIPIVINISAPKLSKKKQRKLNKKKRQ